MSIGSSFSSAYCIFRSTSLIKSNSSTHNLENAEDNNERVSYMEYSIWILHFVGSDLIADYNPSFRSIDKQFLVFKLLENGVAQNM